LAQSSTKVQLNRHSLHLVERHVLGAPIIELRRPRAGMVRHLRRLLKRTAVFEVGGDARRPKRVVANLGRDLGRPRAPLNHSIGVSLGQGIAGEPAGRAAVGLEQKRLRIAREPRAVDIRVEVGFEIVVTRHGVLLAALLMQANL
jgi:hypothetical protein